MQSVPITGYHYSCSKFESPSGCGLQQKCQKYLFINVWRKSVFDIYFTEFGADLTTVLPILFKYCYKYCYSDSRKLWAVMKEGGLALSNLIQPTISLEMPVPSQGHYGFHSFRLLTDFVCLYTYEFWPSLCKIVRSSVILLLPLFTTLLDQVCQSLATGQWCFLCPVVSSTNKTGRHVTTEIVLQEALNTVKPTNQHHQQLKI
jgi:hypothetical protein